MLTWTTQGLFEVETLLDEVLEGYESETLSARPSTSPKSPVYSSKASRCSSVEVSDEANIPITVNRTSTFVTRYGALQVTGPERRNPQTRTGAFSFSNFAAASRSKRKRVAFGKTVGIQTFDKEASACDATIQPITEEKISDRQLSASRYRSTRALRNRDRKNRIDVRFMTADDLTAPRTEFMKGLSMKIRAARRFSGLASGVGQFYDLQFEDSHHGDPLRYPSWVRFRLMQLHPRTNELQDCKRFTKLGGLKKWIRFDSDKEHWDCTHLGLEYKRFLAVCKIAQESERDPEQKYGGSRHLLHCWRRVFQQYGKEESGEDVLRRLAARKIHPVVELLWTSR